MTLLRILVVLAGFLAAGIAFLPLRIVFHEALLPGQQIAVSNVSGTVWRGALEGVTFQGEPLGTFRLRTHVWPLLTGRVRVDFSSDGPLASGQVSLRPSSTLLLNLNGAVPLSRLAASAPEESMVSFKDAGLDLDGVRCKRAGGQTSVTGLSSLGVGDLAGPLGCEGGRLVLALVPQAGGPGADILLDPAAEGGARLTARSRDAVMQAAIIALGIPAEEAPKP